MGGLLVPLSAASTLEVVSTDTNNTAINARFSLIESRIQ